MSFLGASLPLEADLVSAKPALPHPPRTHIKWDSSRAASRTTEGKVSNVPSGLSKFWSFLSGAFHRLVAASGLSWQQCPVADGVGSSQGVWVPHLGSWELPGGDHDVEGDIDLEDLPPLSAPLCLPPHHLPLLPGAFSDHSDSLLSSSGKIKQEKSPREAGYR